MNIPTVPCWEEKQPIQYQLSLSDQPLKDKTPYDLSKNSRWKWTLMTRFHTPATKDIISRFIIRENTSSKMNIIILELIYEEATHKRFKILFQKDDTSEGP
jgi:hypothetical protein